MLYSVCFSYAFLKFSFTGWQTCSTLSIYRHLKVVSEPLRSIKQATWIIWTIYWEEGVEGIKRCFYVFFNIGRFILDLFLNGYCGLWESIMCPQVWNNFVLNLIINVWNIWTDCGRIILVMLDCIDMRVYSTLLISQCHINITVLESVIECLGLHVCMVWLDITSTCVRVLRISTFSKVTGHE